MSDVAVAEGAEEGEDMSGDQGGRPVRFCKLGHEMITMLLLLCVTAGGGSRQRQQKAKQQRKGIRRNRRKAGPMQYVMQYVKRGLPAVPPSSLAGVQVGMAIM
jgi:hypothetical protein